ncbi:hypothetical protein [Pseudomonas kitaguniensis]|uniref:hypothetical protein n=1 Tax=Pseudomonas kitaguniensis TaxID=2607908 RepID=UPI003B9E9C5B
MANDTNEHTIILLPGGRFRLNAGPYDLETSRPRYAVQVRARDEHEQSKVEDNSLIMGPAGRHFYVWDVKNGSTWPVFLTLTVDGVPVAAGYDSQPT